MNPPATEPETPSGTRADFMRSQDASFLFLETESSHMQIALIALFEGPPPRSDEIERMIDAKLDLVPRYRQRVRRVPFDLGPPVWEDDPRFDLNYHVRHTALPQPGDDRQLRTLVGRVMSQPLDHDRPLWELWVIEGVSSDRWAMLTKMHHGLVDGIAGSDLLGVLLDARPDREPRPASQWEPRPRRKGWLLAAESIGVGLRRPSEGLRALQRAIRKPRRALRELAEFGEGLASFHDFSSSSQESSLNGRVGRHRRWCSTDTSLAEIDKIRAAHGGTVNDVILAAVSAGFRALLLSRGEPVDETRVRTLIPVSLRRPDERGQLDNRVTGVFVDLPVEISDPIECLSRVRSEMERVKEHHQIDVAEALVSLADYTPPAFLALGARLFAGLEQHAVQTITTNVPGPRRPLFANGRRMLSAYPYVPLSGSVRIAVAAFSYAGRVGFGITGDYERAADIDRLASGIEDGLAYLRGHA